MQDIVSGPDLQFDERNSTIASARRADAKKCSSKLNTANETMETQTELFTIENAESAGMTSSSARDVVGAASGERCYDELRPFGAHI